MTSNEKFRVTDGFPEYINYSYIPQDGFGIGSGNELLGTDGVATCLVLTLFDTNNRIGELAHISGSSPSELLPHAVVDTLLANLGISKDQELDFIEASLAGEGYVNKSDHKKSSIVKAKLRELNIRIIGEDLENGPGRLVFLHCATGEVEVFRA